MERNFTAVRLRMSAALGLVMALLTTSRAWSRNESKARAPTR